MKKEIITSILVPSLLLYFFGCYNAREITKEEFKNQIIEEDLTLVTKEPKIYKVYQDQYFIQDDTINILKGTKSIDLMNGSTLIKNGSKKPFSGQISLDNVTSIKFNEFNTLLTIGSVISIIVILGVLAVAGFGYGRSSMLD